jgi:release factor glutamine methyltransferase
MAPPDASAPDVPSAVAAALADAERRLAEAGVATPAVDAALLARHATGWSRLELVSRTAESFPPGARTVFEDAVARRSAREPLQLIVGSVGFRHLDLLVRPGVFIPRPETEVLAGEAVARLPAGGVAVEPCTGTGAVAVSVALEADPARVVATDASPGAVDLARVNARRAGAAVEVVEGDLLRPVDPALRGRVDVLVANPPYLAEAELDDVEPEVADWDPYLALVAGPTGHEVSDRLLRAAPAWLAPGGWLLLEVDERRARVCALRARAAGLVDTGVVADLAGRPRIVTARRPPP